MMHSTRPVPLVPLGPLGPLVPLVPLLPPPAPPPPEPVDDEQPRVGIATTEARRKTTLFKRV